MSTKTRAGAPDLTEIGTLKNTADHFHFQEGGALKTSGTLRRFLGCCCHLIGYFVFDFDWREVFTRPRLNSSAYKGATAPVDGAGSLSTSTQLRSVWRHRVRGALSYFLDVSRY